MCCLFCEQRLATTRVLNCPIFKGNILIGRKNLLNEMQKVQILNSREVKVLRENIETMFGYSLEEDYAYLQTDKGRVFIISRDVAKVDWTKLIIDKMGLYFAEVHDKQVRLSKEGAELLWLNAKKEKKMLKNVVSLTQGEVTLYFKGLDLEKDCGKNNKLILLEYNDDVLGCAKYKEGKILNFLPKIHRGEVIL